jgi:hypothetical protein
MGADHHPHRAVGQAVLHGLCLGRRDQAGEVRDRDAKARKAALESLNVLAHENRRRRHDRHLLARERRGRGGAQGHLGLAEAHIAAHQAVHGAAGGEILQGLLDRGELIGCLGEGEAGRETLVGCPGRHELRGGRPFALPHGLHEAPGRRVDRGAHARAPLAPGIAVEPVQGQGFGLSAVAPDPVHVVHRRHQGGAPRVFEPEQIHAGALVSTLSNPRRSPKPCSSWIRASPRRNSISVPASSCGRGWLAPSGSGAASEEIGSGNDSRSGLRVAEAAVEISLEGKTLRFAPRVTSSQLSSLRNSASQGYARPGGGVREGRVSPRLREPPAVRLRSRRERKPPGPRAGLPGGRRLGCLRLRRPA